MIFEGKCKCEKCGEDNEWYYQAAQYAGSGSLDCDCIPTHKQRLHATETTIKGKYKKATKGFIYCKKCNHKNQIDI